MFAHKPITVCLVCLCLCHLIGTVPTGSPVAATTTATAEIEIEPANDTTTVATIEISSNLSLCEFSFLICLFF